MTLSSATLSKPHPLLKALTSSVNPSTFLPAVAEAESQSRHSAVLLRGSRRNWECVKACLPALGEALENAGKGECQARSLPCVLLE